MTIQHISITDFSREASEIKNLNFNSSTNRKIANFKFFHPETDITWIVDDLESVEDFYHQYGVYGYLDQIPSMLPEHNRQVYFLDENSSRIDTSVIADCVYVGCDKSILTDNLYVMNALDIPVSTEHVGDSRCYDLGPMLQEYVSNEKLGFDAQLVAILDVLENVKAIHKKANGSVLFYCSLLDRSVRQSYAVLASYCTSQGMLFEIEVMDQIIFTTSLRSIYSRSCNYYADWVKFMQNPPEAGIRFLNGSRDMYMCIKRSQIRPFTLKGWFVKIDEFTNKLTQPEYRVVRDFENVTIERVDKLLESKYLLELYKFPEFANKCIYFNNSMYFTDKSGIYIFVADGSGVETSWEYVIYPVSYKHKAFVLTLDATDIEDLLIPGAWLQSGTFFKKIFKNSNHYPARVWPTHHTAIGVLIGGFKAGSDESDLNRLSRDTLRIWYEKCAKVRRPSDEDLSQVFNIAEMYKLGILSYYGAADPFAQIGKPSVPISAKIFKGDLNERVNK